MTDTHSAPKKWELTDIPGIGPGLAERLRKADILTVDDFKSARLDDIAAIHGISRAQAVEMKAFARVFRGQQGRLDSSSPESIWQDTSRELRRRLASQLSEVSRLSKDRKLKKKFRSQLGKLGSVLERLPDDPPLDEEQRAKILKHMRALEKLLANAALLQSHDTLHQKVMRDRIRYRRKKLAKWIGRHAVD